MSILLTSIKHYKCFFFICDCQISTFLFLCTTYLNSKSLQESGFSFTFKISPEYSYTLPLKNTLIKRDLSNSPCKALENMKPLGKCYSIFISVKHYTIAEGVINLDLWHDRERKYFHKEHQRTIKEIQGEAKLRDTMAQRIQKNTPACLTESVWYKTLTPVVMIKVMGVKRKKHWSYLKMEANTK